MGVCTLQGGPGCASLFGNFYELGPHTLRGGKLKPNRWSWNQAHGLLFIDQPLGTGFSKPGPPPPPPYHPHQTHSITYPPARPSHSRCLGGGGGGPLLLVFPFVMIGRPHNS